jgi:hypothetical protein
MSGQAEQLQQTMAFFRLDSRAGRPALKLVARRPPAAPGAPMQAAPSSHLRNKNVGDGAVAVEREPDEANFAKF